ncbi:unnamed protein product [Zymoseptoria tritici ST99CH_1A5]|uniref:Uncharacterized protein n=1 Tax=Zymoseptoria tritici ST99CH_1A5 TaxID=1276529 RepID=A0A1Y6M1S0_ZYMTR|nr:unnamed protein product [Zymoseptoria tritici ST99CH_1A5]
MVAVNVPLHWLRPDTICQRYRLQNYAILNDPSRTLDESQPVLRESSSSECYFGNLTFGSLARPAGPGPITWKDLPELSRDIIAFCNARELCEQRMPNTSESMDLVREFVDLSFGREPAHLVLVCIYRFIRSHIRVPMQANRHVGADGRVAAATMMEFSRNGYFDDPANALAGRSSRCIPRRSTTMIMSGPTRLSPCPRPPTPRTPTLPSKSASKPPPVSPLSPSTSPSTSPSRELSPYSTSREGSPSSPSEELFISAPPTPQVSSPPTEQARPQSSGPDPDDRNLTDHETRYATTINKELHHQVIHLIDQIRSFRDHDISRLHTIISELEVQTEGNSPQGLFLHLKNHTLPCLHRMYEDVIHARSATTIDQEVDDLVDKIRSFRDHDVSRLNGIISELNVQSEVNTPQGLTLYVKNHTLPRLHRMYEDVVHEILQALLRHEQELVDRQCDTASLIEEIRRQTTSTTNPNSLHRRHERLEAGHEYLSQSLANLVTHDSEEETFREV